MKFITATKKNSPWKKVKFPELIYRFNVVYYLLIPKPYKVNKRSTYQTINTLLMNGAYDEKKKKKNIFVTMKKIEKIASNQVYLYYIKQYFLSVCQCVVRP